MKKRHEFYPPSPWTVAPKREHAQCLACGKERKDSIHFPGYYIMFQWRRGAPNGPHNDWRSWRTFAAWPKVFPSREAADAHLANCGDPFRGLRDYRRGLSASVVHVGWRPGPRKDTSL